MRKQTKVRSSRAQSEKKTNVTSIRYTDEQRAIIRQNAKASNMPVSTYLLTCGINGEKSLTPADVVYVQNLINEACAFLEPYEPDKIEYLQNGAFKLWQKLL